jgi:hypothetical protein
MRYLSLVVMAVVVVGGVLAEKPGDAKDIAPIVAAGVLTENKSDSFMIWIDGEDIPVKFAYGAGFDKTAFGFPPKNKGVFSPDRVQFTYTKGDDGNKLLAIKRAPTPTAGTVTGVVLFSNDFWVAVKPKAGPLDGYAIIWPPGEMAAKLKSLQKGDTVTIKFHTDVERHRIETLVVAAKPAGPATPPEGAAPAVSKTPTSHPEAATSQPTVADSPAEKLKLAQIYLDNGMKAKAREMLENLIKECPGTKAAQEAKAKLAALGG